MTLNMTYLDKVKYNSQDFNQRFADIFGNGILTSTDFPVTYPSTANMTLNIGIGVAIIDGYRINNDAVTTLTVNAADATNPRIDIVELGYNVSTDANGMTTGNAVLQIKQGVAAASPVEPGADTGFIKLYSINVAANATSISSTNVTDKRGLVPLNVNGSQISIGGAQKTIYQQSTAPLSPVDQDLWIDTSVTPNAFKRYNAATTSWVKVTPTVASEVGAPALTDFTNSFVTNGYQKLPNGLILQWLEYDASSTNFTSGTKQTFNFNWPIAFPTACLSGVGNLVGGVSYASYTNFQTNNFSKTGGSADITIGNTATYSPIFKVWGVGY